MSRMLGVNIWARRHDVGLWIGSGCAVPRRTRSAQRHYERQLWERDYEDDMAKMLMDAADRGDASDRDDSHRTEQRMRERRQWQKEAEMPRDEAVQADADNDPEPDCRHGCNGDCLVSGSEVCTWQCHSYESVEPYFKARLAKLERVRWEATRDIYAIRESLTRLAADELTRLGQELGD